MPRTKSQQRVLKQGTDQLPLVRRQKQRRNKKMMDWGRPYALPGSAAHWRDWLRPYYPHLVHFAPRHVRLWDWFAVLTPGVKPAPRVEPWPRGGAKSSTGEFGCAYAGARLSRHFVLYVSETQSQADKHVQAVSSIFEKLGVGRAVNKYGHSKGWKRDQLRTENGFNVAALGLDTAARGIRLDEFRPDLIIFDDIDGRHDTPKTTKKKIELITDTILPAGSADCAILFLQNLIQEDSIVSQLCDGRAPFLHNREAAQVEKAVIGLETRRVEVRPGIWGYEVIDGTPTWEGQDLITVAAQINEWGLASFLRESQQEVQESSGGLWVRERDIDPFYVDEEHPMPALQQIVIAVDPSGSARGDEAGIVAAGVGRVGGDLHGYALDDLSMVGSPKQWIDEAVRAFRHEKANRLLAEINFGGEIVSAAFEGTRGAPPVTMVSVSRGKLIRAEPVHGLYERGQIHHVKRLPNLEKQLCTWKPGGGMPSPGALDALVIAFSFLFDLHEMVREVKPAAAIRPMAYGFNRR